MTGALDESVDSSAPRGQAASEAPLRIALVTHSFAWENAGGGEVMVRLLATELARAGHDVTVISPDPRGSAASPVRYHRIEKLSMMSVRRALRELRPDVVDVHNMEAVPAAILAARSLRIPAVVTASSAWTTCLFADMFRPGHGICVTCSVEGVADCFAHRPAAQIGRRVPAIIGYAETRRRLALVKQAKIVVAHSHASEDLLARNGVHASRIRVIPNMDEPGFARVHAPEGELVLFVGGLTRNKGADSAVEAFALLTARRPHARLVMAGEGHLRPELARTAAALGVADKVQMPGYVAHDAIAQLYARAAVVLFPSRAEETFGRIIFEAWNAGAPLVATRISAPGELVKDGDTGLLVDPEDPKQIADAMARVLDEPELGARLAANGRAALAAYAPHMVAPRYVAAYREAIHA